MGADDGADVVDIHILHTEALLDGLCQELGIGGDECSADGKYSLAATRCIGACGLAPVLTVNDEVYGRLTDKDVPVILAKYK